MLRIYDKDHHASGYITKYKDLKIESDVSTGDKTLSFTYLAKKHPLEEEWYVETEEDEYVIKEKNASSNGFIQYVACLNLEDLEAKPWEKFNVAETNIADAAALALAGTGWIIKECTVTKKRSAGILQTNTLGVLQKLCTAFMCEILYDTKNKTVSFYEQVGSDKGTYLMSGLNMRKIQRRGSTYDYYTKIIPIGANGLTIEEINDGKKYLENHQYSAKTKTYIWKDESYTDAAALKEDAEKKLDDMSKPEVSYSADIVDLARQNPKYKILDFDIGDTVTLVDASTGIKEKQRIVKITRYPQNKEKDSCELANKQPSFEETRRKLQEAQQIIDAVISDDGKYNGTINVSDILKFEEGISKSETVSGLQNSYDSLNKSYSELALAVGKMNTNQLTAEQADMKYAKIDFANITEATMEQFYAKSGLIKNATIENQHITGELVGVKFSGDLIEGETIVANKLVIKGEDGLYYKLNTDGVTVEKEQTDYNSLNGQVIRAKSVTSDKIYVSDLAAFDATIGGFHISDDAIYSGMKSSLDNLTEGIYTSKDGQISIGEADKYIKYYTTDSGKRRLEIRADEFTFSTGKSIRETLQEGIDDLEIGGRNLIRNSMTLLYKDYYFTTYEETDDIYIADENGYVLLDEINNRLAI